MKEKTFKIVKVVVALAIAAGAGIGTVVNQMNINKDDSQDRLEAAKEILQQQESRGETSILDETTIESKLNETQVQETEEEVTVYDIVEYDTIVDHDATFDELVEARKEFYKQMEEVLSNSKDYSEQAIFKVIYNVARIDKDLSDLLVKTYEKTLKDAEKKVYIAEQIEMLEKVLLDMKMVKNYIAQCEKDTKDEIEDLTKSQASQIERVRRYTLLTLEEDISELESYIEKLNDELESALASQP